MLDRKSSEHDVDILENYNFTNKVDADVITEDDPFKRKLPNSTIKYKDLTEKHEDFVPNEQHLQYPYYKDLIEKIKDWIIYDYKFKNGTRKHYHTS